MNRPLLVVFLIIGLLGPGVAQAQSRSLPLREGDRILVKLWMDTVFADSARVQDRGIVILPRVGPVSILNVPATHLADSVRNAYALVFRALTVEVTPLRKVTIVGEVRRPAIYYLEPQTTMREAIAMAGGVTEIGKFKRLTLIRDSAQIRIKDWQQKGDDESFIRSGDIVIAEREP